MNKPKILVIVGPTASGKSALAVELARKFDGEVISADSRQVYRGLDIGTGKVTKKEMLGIRHHLLEVASPKKNFTAHEFTEKARAAMLRIAARGSLPIIVGGTGFYIDALIGRTTLPDIPPNKPLRTRLQKRTSADLFAMLKKVDPRRAKIMNTPSERNNKVRLIRALEIAAATGKVQPRHKKASQISQVTKDSALFDALWIGIRPSQKELDRRIKARLQARIRAGMIAEAKRLQARGLSYKRMQELGLEYRSLARYLQKKISRKEFETELFRDIRRYGKKQFTYWKRNKDIRWFPSARAERLFKAVAVWLEMR